MALPAALRAFLQRQALAWFIARHYLFSRERRALEWLVTGISVLGVAVGVGTIISVVSVMDGMNAKVIGSIVSFVPHVRLEPKDKKADPDPALLARLRARPGVEACEPILHYHVALIFPRELTLKDEDGERKSRQEFVRLHAAEELAPDNIYNVVIPPDQPPLRLRPDSVLIGERLTTAPLAGQTVRALSDKVVRTPLLPIPKQKLLTMQGTFKSENEYFGRWMAFAPWDVVRRLALSPTGYNYLHLKLKEPLAADRVAADLEKELGAGFKVVSWRKEFARMFSAMRIAKAGMLAIMLMTIVVAALNIIGTLALIVIQKTAEIGILRAMGASSRLVGRIFLAEGALVGVVGSVLGVAMGLTFCALLQLLKIPDPFATHRRIPVEIDPAMVALTALGAVLVCTLAALAPAHRASRLRPVEALRSE